MYSVKIILIHDGGDPEAPQILAEKMLTLPFAPCKGLRLDFGGDDSAIVEIEDAIWDVLGEGFECVCKAEWSIMPGDFQKEVAGWIARGFTIVGPDPPTTDPRNN